MVDDSRLERYCAGMNLEVRKSEPSDMDNTKPGLRFDHREIAVC